MINSLKIDLKVYKLDVVDVNNKVYPSFKDHRFWLQKAQKNMLYQADYDTALDYLASGLRELPLNIQLLYNYAVYSLKRLKH